MESWVFEADYASRSLCDHFHLLALDGCGLDHRPLATGAASAILHYLRDTQRAALDHLERPSFYDRADALVLDATTIRNLELVEPLFAGESREATLLSVLDRTRTGMGGRLLRRRLLAPSLDITEIEARLDAVEEIHTAAILRAALAKDLSGRFSIWSVCSRKSVSPPPDLGMCWHWVARSPSSLYCGSELWNRVPPVSANYRAALTMSPKFATACLPPSPKNLPSTSMTAARFAPASIRVLTNCATCRRTAKPISPRSSSVSATAPASARSKSASTTSSVITSRFRKPTCTLRPADYERKQTLVNAERFTTPELKELEVKILEAEERMLTIEREIFEALRALASSHAVRIKATAAAIAELDVRWPLPKSPRNESLHASAIFWLTNEPGEMRVVAGRHPVIEKLTEQDAQRFIPNDLYFHPETEFIAVITGPEHGRQIDVSAAGRAACRSWRRWVRSCRPNPR